MRAALSTSIACMPQATFADDGAPRSSRDSRRCTDRKRLPALAGGAQMMQFRKRAALPPEADCGDRNVAKPVARREAAGGTKRLLGGGSRRLVVGGGRSRVPAAGPRVGCNATAI